jgi:general secretion pathway protein C
MVAVSCSTIQQFCIPTPQTGFDGMQRLLLPLNIGLSFLLVMVLALIAADLLGYRLKRLFPTTGALPASAVTRSAAPHDIAVYAPIVEKGLFGAATRGRLTPIAAAPAAPAAAAAPAVAPGDFLLLGTAVGSFRETFALVQKVSTREERVFRLGDTVFGVGPLIAVRKEQAELLVNGQRVKLVTPLVAGAAPGAGAVPPHPVPAGAPGGLAAPQGAGSYVIDQRALNAALDNIGQAMTDARLLPSMKDGKVEGFRASEVKPQGIFGTVGIRNGDVLMRINDFAIDSPEKAIQSFVTLKGQNRIKLDLVRDGQPTTFTYDIR